jgi:hypothetical protein
MGRSDSPLRLKDGLQITKRIFTHLGLWESKPRPPTPIPKAQPRYTEPRVDYSDSQVSPSDDGFYIGLQYQIDHLIPLFLS